MCDIRRNDHIAILNIRFRCDGHGQACVAVSVVNERVYYKRGVGGGEGGDGNQEDEQESDEEI